MDPIGFFLLLTSLLLSYPFVLIAQNPSNTTTISVVGVVYCDTCSTGTFSKHSYFLSGVEVHIECRFRASSPRSNEQINFSVNRTTDRNGAYKLDIPSVDGDNCESSMDGGNSEIVTLCEASLIGTSSSSYSCNVPFLKSTRNSEISKQDNNLCVYSLGSLSYKPPIINAPLCSN
ncbi:pollen-specific protein-like At4g18596 [Vicia villosa]|uniref:pollen-specific protein-like At4g18596 n=1 Tax=Vicia villosa TaxID=3911 RepID=UPI00273AF6C2|nr:pollen-specific protein-like At4g18596 [Vicia villosa]